MVMGKTIRCWILGLSCTVVPFTGCAHAPTSSPGGLFSWFRSTPLTERELQTQERNQAARRLQDPAHLLLKYAQWRENVGDLADARQSYQNALKENPKSLEAKLGLARLDQLGGHTEEAERGFRNALDSRPGDPQAQNALGQFYAAQKEWSKAIPLLEEAAESAPHEMTFRYHLGVAMALSGDVNGAFPHLRQAVGEAEAHYNLGYLMYEKGHVALAKQRFQQALALNPKLMQAQAMLEELDPKPKQTVLAEAPTPRPPAFANPIQQTAGTQSPPVRIVEQAVPQQSQPTTRPALLPPPSSAPPTPLLSNGTNPPEAVSKPGAFRATQPQRWRPTETSAEDAEYLPPFEPPVKPNAPPARVQAPVTAPPITPAQREQWENQVRASSLP